MHLILYVLVIKLNSATKRRQKEDYSSQPEIPTVYPGRSILETETS